MIARFWRGWTSHANADRYERLFRDTVLPRVTDGVTGLKGTNLLRQDAGREVEFTTIFWFDSLADVKTFAGDHFLEAVVPGEVQALMCRFEHWVQHHNVVL
ncbi:MULTISPECIES: antibiotic biosynthesis monooxygenase [Marinobacter]|uniref:antibiotic biosynthesis monooxygenase n=1 Tax=Marinobacter TaxID=2742 RepID=UPI000DAC445E|nr:MULTISPECIES: antibiotic biosynthesis monooxygenase [Marinobacter]